MKPTMLSYGFNRERIVMVDGHGCVCNIIFYIYQSVQLPSYE